MHDLDALLPPDLRPLRWEVREGERQIIAPTALTIARFAVDPMVFVEALERGLIPAVMRPRNNLTWLALEQRFREEQLP